MIRSILALTAGTVFLTACIDIDLRNRSQPDPVATPAAVAPPTVQPVPRTAKERLVEAIEANGCTLTADNVSAVLSQATISAQELTSLAPQLESEGRAEVSGSGAIRVRTDACTAA